MYLMTTLVQFCDTTASGSSYEASPRVQSLNTFKMAGVSQHGQQKTF